MGCNCRSLLQALALLLVNCPDSVTRLKSCGGSQFHSEDCCGVLLLKLWEFTLWSWEMHLEDFASKPHSVLVVLWSFWETLSSPDAFAMCHIASHFWSHPGVDSHLDDGSCTLKTQGVRPVHVPFLHRFSMLATQVCLTRSQWFARVRHPIRTCLPVRFVH